jgi:hypothetical protein
MARLRVAPAFWWTTLAMALAALDLSRHLFIGWVPHDEGALGLAAALVRAGAWPHREFADIYSGGLAFLDAGTQLLLGDSIRALRIPLALASIAWVGLLAACFRRFTAAPAAAGLALLAFLWGPPLYPSPIPSWYLLFLATGVVWALFRWQETGAPRWWGLLGVLIGVGIFLKVNALFLLAGAGTVLLVGRPDPEGRSTPELGGRVASGVIAAVAILGALGGAVVILRGWGWVSSWSLALPLMVVGIVAAERIWSAPGSARERILALRTPLLWLAGGLAAILIPWVAAYATQGAAGALAEGVLVLPFRRSTFAALLPPLPGLIELAAAVAFVLLVRPPRAAPAARAIAGVILLVAAWSIWRGRSNDVVVIEVVWRSLRVFGVATLLLLGLHWSRDEGRPGGPFVAVASVTAWFALLQYPFAAPIYLVYVAPLLILAAAALVHATATPRPVAVALALAVGGWALGTGHGQAVYDLGRRFHPPLPAATLPMPRGGIDVPAWEVAEYTQIVRCLDDWGARKIIAGPDAPQVYYLSGRTKPDRDLFEFFDPAWSATTFARRIDSLRPDAVVLDLDPDFSRIDLDSVLTLTRMPPVADTTIGGFRLLRFADPDARP